MRAADGQCCQGLPHIPSNWSLFNFFLTIHIYVANGMADMACSICKVVGLMVLWTVRALEGWAPNGLGQIDPGFD